MFYKNQIKSLVGIVLTLYSQFELLSNRMFFFRISIHILRKEKKLSRVVFIAVTFRENHCDSD